MNTQPMEKTLARKIAEQGAKYVTPAQAKNKREKKIDEAGSNKDSSPPGSRLKKNRV